MLGEDGIIALFQKEMKGRAFVPEDVEVARFSGRDIIIKTDTMVQSTDIPRGMGLRDAARKSVVACVSDFAAKGVRPRYGVISANIPRSATRSDVRDIARGIGAAAKEFGVAFLGGDTNGGRELVLNVCMVGEAAGIVPRGGAKVGDLVFVTGPFGHARAGIAELKRGKSNRPSAAARAALRPKPRLAFGLGAKPYLTSSMDSSDGLSTTLNAMASSSKKRFMVGRLPAKAGTLKGLGARKVLRAVFDGGEEYEFAFTANPRHRGRIAKIARDTKTPVIEIGLVEEGSGVALVKGGTETTIMDGGWRHLKR